MGYFVRFLLAACVAIIAYAVYSLNNQEAIQVSSFLTAFSAPRFIDSLYNFVWLHENNPSFNEKLDPDTRDTPDATGRIWSAAGRYW